MIITLFLVVILSGFLKISAQIPLSKNTSIKQWIILILKKWNEDEHFKMSVLITTFCSLIGSVILLLLNKNIFLVAFGLMLIFFIFYFEPKAEISPENALNYTKMNMKEIYKSTLEDYKLIANQENTIPWIEQSHHAKNDPYIFMYDFAYTIPTIKFKNITEDEFKGVLTARLIQRIKQPNTYYRDFPSLIIHDVTFTGATVTIEVIALLNDTTFDFYQALREEQIARSKDSDSILEDDDFK